MPSSYASPRMRRRVFNSQGGLCFYCGHLLSPYRFTIDHLLPRRVAPQMTNARRNMVAACAQCNHAKCGRVLPWDRRHDRVVLLLARRGVRHPRAEMWMQWIRGRNNRPARKGVLLYRREIIEWVARDQNWPARSEGPRRRGPGAGVVVCA